MAVIFSRANINESLYKNMNSLVGDHDDNLNLVASKNVTVWRYGPRYSVLTIVAKL